NALLEDMGLEEWIHPYQTLETEMISYKGVALKESQFTLYPNPAKDELFIELGEIFETESGSIEILDQLGRKLLTRDIDKDVRSVRVDLKKYNLGRGLYHVSIVKNGKRIDSQKFLIH